MKSLSEIIFDISRQVGWFPPWLLPVGNTLVFRQATGRRKGGPVGNMKSTPPLSLLQRRGRDNQQRT